MDGTARIWDTARLWDADQRPGTSYPPSDTPAKSGAVAVTSDGQRIVTGGGEGPVKLWDAVSGHELRNFRECIPPRDHVRRFNPGRAANRHGRMGRYSQALGCGQRPRTPELHRAHRAYLEGLARNQTGRVTAGLVRERDDGHGSVWEVTMAQHGSPDALAATKSSPLMGTLAEVAVSRVTPDGQRMVTGGCGQHGQGLGCDSAAANSCRLNQHTGGVSSVAVTRGRAADRHRRWGWHGPALGCGQRPANSSLSKGTSGRSGPSP